MTHSTATLGYSLLDGPVSLEPLRVLDARAFAWGAWDVAVFVLGTSHAVCLEQGEQRLTELLACSPLPSTARVVVSAPAHLPQAFCRSAFGLTCRVQMAPFTLAEGDDLLGGYADQLAVAYPHLPDGLTPMTRVGWQIDGKLLTVETVHTYPEEGRGVRSRSVWVGAK